jgi:hypothetical protein
LDDPEHFLLRTKGAIGLIRLRLNFYGASGPLVGLKGFRTPLDAIEYAPPTAVAADLAADALRVLYVPKELGFIKIF